MIDLLPCGTIYCYWGSKACWFFLNGENVSILDVYQRLVWYVGQMFSPPGNHIQVHPEEWQDEETDVSSLHPQPTVL